MEKVNSLVAKQKLDFDNWKVPIVTLGDSIPCNQNGMKNVHLN